MKWLNQIVSYYYKVIDFIRKTKPYRLVRLWCKKIRPPGFHQIPLYDVLKFFFQQINQTSINQRAAAISFNAMLAIPAGLIFLFTLIPYFPSSIKNDIASEINYFAKNISPTQGTEIWVTGFIKDFVRTPRGGLLSTGFFIVLYAASNAMMGIMTSFNSQLIERRKRNFFQLRFTAIKLTLLLSIFIFVTIFLIVTEGRLLRWLLQYMQIERVTISNIILYSRWAVIFALLFFGIGSIYKYAPQQPIRWQLISPGSILATFLTVIFFIFFSWYLNRFGRYNELYGSVGTILVLCLLIFFNSLVLLVGYELNVAIYALKRSRDPNSSIVNTNLE
jgi:membrane protein